MDTILEDKVHFKIVISNDFFSWLWLWKSKLAKLEGLAVIIPILKKKFYFNNELELSLNIAGIFSENSTDLT